MANELTTSVVIPLWQDRPALENLEVAVAAEERGYRELWIGEMATFDAFAFATAVGLKCRNLSVTVGPLGVHIRTPMTMAMGVASVAELTGAQVRLALGTSSDIVVGDWHGLLRRRPAQTLEESAIVSAMLLGGERVTYEGEMVRSVGYRLRLTAQNPSVTIAAFGPEAINVAARRSSRLVLNMVTPEAVSTIRAQLREEAERHGNPHPKIAIWLGTSVDPSEDALLQIRRSMVAYLAAPGYAEMFSKAGFGEVVALAKTRPHPREVLAAMPHELCATVGLVGDVETIRARIEEYRLCGVDEVCLVPATADDPAGRRTLTALAPDSP